LVVVIATIYRLLLVLEWLDFHFLVVSVLFRLLLLPMQAKLMPPTWLLFPLLFHFPHLQYPVVV
jgi:hypothetical protein